VVKGDIMSDAVWPNLAAERRAFAGYLATLSVEDLEKPSPCAGWRVREVVAHVIAGAKSTPPKFIGGLISSGFNFAKAGAKLLLPELDGTPAELSARLSAAADRKTQPGKALLGEVIVHAEDVRCALGADPGDHPAGNLLIVANYYKNAGAPLKVKARIAGITLRATDADFGTGEGPEVSGPLLPLILAMTGRGAALDQLAGPGVDTLRGRIGL
jgi:uncharacterized protein (TIGR03083 family)